VSGKWRRIRTAFTIIMALIGAGLLAVAWLSLGHVPGAAAVDLAMLGLVLPAGFYGVFTLVGWQRTGAGATPGAFIAWCLRHRLAAFVPFAFMFLLLGMMLNLSQALDRQDTPDTAAGRASGG
jgi:hypothetical protein